MKILGRLLAGLWLLLLPALASAQDFPNKPINLIVPFPAGGPNDIIARIVCQRMSQILKHPIRTYNRRGQGGAPCTTAVTTAAPSRHPRPILNPSRSPL